MFKKGYTPWNKGTKGIVKANSGSFKKGEHRSPRTEFKQGHPAPKTAFKKGNIPMAPFKKGQSGDKAGHWKGGQMYNGQGYILIYTPAHPFATNNKYVREHRLVVEKQLGRYLFPKEMVHHINRIKDDNRPENLMAFVNRASHVSFEKGDNVAPSKIIFDGRLL